MLNSDESLGKFCLNQHTFLLCELKLENQIMTAPDIAFVTSCRARALDAVSIVTVTVASSSHSFLPTYPVTDPVSS
jgi:hypothetical protein